MKQRLVYCLALMAALGSIHAGASAEDLASALAECRAHEDERARLACYDRMADRLAAPAAPPLAAPAPAPETLPPVATSPASDKQPAKPRVPAAGASKPEEFGYRGGPLARADAAREDAGTKSEEGSKEGGGEIVAKVTEVVRRPSGVLVITLENGQTWVQKAPDGRFTVKYGDRVRVESATLRSYLMYREDSKRGTRVMRIR